MLAPYSQYRGSCRSIVADTRHARFLLFLISTIFQAGNSLCGAAQIRARFLHGTTFIAFL